MKIYLLLRDRLVNFFLPKEVEGSFSFDCNIDEESKLINIEARDNKWVIYSTNDSKIVSNNNFIDSVFLASNSFYVLRRNNVDYLIYVTDLISNDLVTYSFDKELNTFLYKSISPLEL